MTTEAWALASDLGMRVWVPKPGAKIGTVCCKVCGWGGDIACDLEKYAAEPYGCGRKVCGNFARRSEDEGS